MASICFFMMLMQSEPSAITIDSETLNSAVALIRRGDASAVEDFLVAMFQERSYSHTSNIYVVYSPSIVYLGAAWFISLLFLFLIIPCIPIVYRCLRQKGWISGKAQRRRKLYEDLKNYRKIISNDDSVDCHTTETSGEEHPKWMVPPPGKPSYHEEPITSLELREVTGLCAICLAPYSSGETIVWASNPKCVHCFHESCIISWLLRKRNHSTQQCPCCRQAFLEGS